MEQIKKPACSMSYYILR